MVRRFKVRKSKSGKIISRTEVKSFKKKSKSSSRKVSKVIGGIRFTGSEEFIQRQIDRERGKKVIAPPKPTKTPAQLEVARIVKARAEAKIAKKKVQDVQKKQLFTQASQKQLEEARKKIEKKKVQDVQKKQLFTQASQKQLEEARKKIEKKKVTTGVIRPTPSPRTKRRISFIKTPAEVRFEGREIIKQKPISSFVKRASADVVSGVGGLVNLAKDISLSTIPISALRADEGIAARKRIRNIFTLTTLTAAGAAIGKDLQSTDAYEKTRGLVTIVGNIVGTPVGGTSFKAASSISKYTVNSNLVSGSTKIKTTTKGVLEDGTPFTQKSTLRLDPKTKTVVGNVRTTIKKKSFSEVIKLKDKGAFFSDASGKLKIPKVTQPLKDIRISIKETKSTQKDKDIRRTFEGNVVKTGQRDIEVKKIKIVKDPKKTITVTRTKRSKIDFIADVKEEGTKLKEVISIPKLVDAQVQIRRTPKSKAFDSRKITNFLKAIRYDVDIINGLDKRTRLAIALGLKKNSPLLRKVETNIGKGTTVTRSGRLKGSGFTETIRPLRFSIGLSFPKVFKPLTKSEKKSLFKVPKTISVPDLKVRIKKIQSLKLRGLIPPTETAKVLDRLNKQLKKLLEEAKEKIKVPVKEKIPLKKVKQKVIPKQKTPLKSKSVTKKKPGKKVIFPKLKAPVKGKAGKIRGIPLRTKNLKRSGSRQGFIILIKEGDIIIARSKELLPRKRATNIKRTILDNTIQASGELVPKGKTSIVDVKNTILGRKFRVKRSKKTKVLTNVEKRKFRLDTKGETKSKALRTTKNKKTLSKAKKTKKVSNKASKKRKNK